MTLRFKQSVGFIRRRIDEGACSVPRNLPTSRYVPTGEICQDDGLRKGTAVTNTYAAALHLPRSPR